MAEEDSAPDGQERLLVSAQIQLQQEPDRLVALQRGMAFYSREGLAVGHLAAVIVSGNPPRPGALLLDRLPTYLDYRVVSLALVSEVNGAAVTLLLDARAVARLPKWHHPVES